MISPPVELLGAQRPRLCSAPPAVTSAGQEAIDLAESAGLILDPWECHALDVGLGEKRDGTWAAFEVGLVVARQNGKGSVLEARELAGLYLFGEELIVHTAHEFRTSSEAFRRILALIESTPDLDRRVLRVTRAHGDEGIELRGGQRLRYLARTGGSGRGFTGDVVILDEAYNIPDSALSALLPTMATRPNPQLWYASSAVDQTTHLHGMVLARVRRRGLAGDDPSLAYLEYSVDAELDDPELEATARDAQSWAQANPGLGIRIPADHVEREHRSMSLRTFAVERLSIGDWPADEDERETVIDLDLWRSLADLRSAPQDPVAFAVDISPDRTAAIAVAGRRVDGLLHVEVADHRVGTGWVVGRLAEMVARWKPVAVVLDPTGPAGALLAELREAGVDLTLTGARDMAQACGGFYNAVQDQLVRHRGQAVLDAALKGAAKRTLGEAWAWSRRNSTTDISPLVAVTLARFGLVSTERPAAPAPPPVMAERSYSSETSRLATAGF